MLEKTPKTKTLLPKKKETLIPKLRIGWEKHPTLSAFTRPALSSGLRATQSQIKTKLRK